MYSNDSDGIKLSFFYKILTMKVILYHKIAIDPLSKEVHNGDEEISVFWTKFRPDEISILHRQCLRTCTFFPPIWLNHSPAIHAGEWPFKTTHKKRRKEKQAMQKLAWSFYTFLD
jgi:hypothetical protein